MTNRTKVLFLFLAMLGAISVRAYAQQKTSEKISPKERWAFETNAMDCGCCCCRMPKWNLTFQVLPTTGG